MDEAENTDAGDSPGVEDLAEDLDLDAVSGDLDGQTLYNIAIGAEPCEARELMVAARTYVAVLMRKQGHGYREIATFLHISLSTAHGYVARAVRKLLRDEIDTIRQLQIDRLNTLLVVYFEKAEAGDTFAANVVFQIMDRVDRLYGIEPPKRVEHTFTDGALDGARRDLAKTLAALGVADAGGEGASYPFPGAN